MPKSRPTSVASGQGDGDHQRFESKAFPKLLKAAEKDDIETVQKILQEAIQAGQMSDSLLRVALTRSAEKGKVTTTRYLLSQGARPDAVASNRPSPLFRAAERGLLNIVQLLLDHGASTETRDKEGRTALMIAAMNNDYHMLRLLVSRGANVNAKDLKKKNILHILAADKQRMLLHDVIKLLLETNIFIDGDDTEGRDELQRTPLHWACAVGTTEFARTLLKRPVGPPADVNATEIRNKTPLHIAAAHQDRDDLVQLLIENHADVHARSDGGWTPLHSACETGSLKVVRLLVEARADINARVIKGQTPLHIAAQQGWVDVVKYLLSRKEIKRNVRDHTGSTPFLMAAAYKRRDILELLAPYNNVEALSEDALGASYGFHATIVDFGNFRNENRVERKKVYDLLYGRDAQGKHTVPIRPENVKSVEMRWIHIPANNMAWIEALLTKIFIEEGAKDVEGFKHLERSFEHQHRGQRVHSHFMRPICTSMPRAPKVLDEESSDMSTSEPGPPTIVLNGKISKPPETPTIKNVKKGKEDTSAGPTRDQIHPKKRDARKKQEGKDKGTKYPGPKGTPQSGPSRNSSLIFDGRVRSPGSPRRKDPNAPSKANICTYMPYLHFETSSRREEMEEAIDRAESFPAMFRRAQTADECLIRAHLTSSSTTLHVRRTLDQFFYHNIDTRSRDRDQVVYRYQTRAKPHFSHEEDVDPKVLMVDQLWMWILGKDLVVTSFPQRWKQPKDDPLNVLDGIIQDINSRTKDPVKTVYDLAWTITGRCSGLFDRHRIGDNDYQFLDMFESSIGSVTDRETMLFKEFNEASEQASDWLRRHRKPNRFSRHLESTSRQQEHAAKRNQDDKFHFEEHSHEPLFVDKLLDIGQETDLLAETKDIRDELNMMRLVLQQQLEVLPVLRSSIIEIYKEEHRNQGDVKKRSDEQKDIIEHHINDIDRMDKQAERIYKSITDLLDLKQKHANAFEARFARDQAAGTARQGQTIMVFTIVTIIFLPLSFIAAVFAIQLPEWENRLHWGYVSRYMFGIGFAISVPLVIIALSVDNIGDAIRELRRRFSRHGAGAENTRDMRTLADIRMEHNRTEHSLKSTAMSTMTMRSPIMNAVDRHPRRSGETERVNFLLPVTSFGSARSPERNQLGNGHVREKKESINGSSVPPPPQPVKTGFRMRNSRDIERGE